MFLETPDKEKIIWNIDSNKTNKKFPVSKILDFQWSIPSIFIKQVPLDSKFYDMPVFEILIDKFNEIYDKKYSFDQILYSKSRFRAFYDFVFSLTLSWKLKIKEWNLNNFMLKLEELQDEYSQNARSIDKYYDEIVETIYYPQWLTKKSEKVKQAMYYFEQAYSLMKLVFEKEERDSGERYFEHLKWVMEIILRDLDNPNLNKILIALLHDIQEDMPEYADSVRIIYGDYIADGVNSLSKRPRENYLTSEELNGCWCYLQEKKAMFDIVAKRIIKKYPDKSFISEKKIKEKELILYMTEEELQKYRLIEDILKPFVEKTKERRNQDYFGHLDELNDDYLDVKLADRIHNLRDMDARNKEKILRKIEETEKYFMEVAKRRNPKAYKILCEEIARLKITIQL